MSLRPALVRAAALALVAGGLVLGGCTGSSETVTVTQRPEPIPSTEEPQAPPEPVLTAFPAGYDTVAVPPFAHGKMWPFESVPARYFADAYGVEADSAWLRKARLGGLRFANGCSASFVSEQGLIMTNHHCARDYVESVSAAGEDLLEDGFYAENVTDERRADDLFVDRLVDIRDVTNQVYGSSEVRRSADATGSAREQVASRLGERLTQEAQLRDPNLRVEVVPLFSGARYSAYTFRRYGDVRLVMVPELQLGYFGGSPDNFTYPRYAFDVAFVRAYDERGNPVRPGDFFRWSTEGVREGDAVFVVGNPGSTSRRSTVAQLRYARDESLPRQLSALRTRAALMDAYIDAHPSEAQVYDLRNSLFSLQNSIKAYTGQASGLRDPVLIARRTAAERRLQRTLLDTDSLRADYGGLVREIEQLQQTKAVSSDKAGALVAFASPRFGSRVLTRGIYAYFYDQLGRRGASTDRLTSIRDDAIEIGDWPDELEEQFIAARLREVRDGFGQGDPTVRKIFADATPEEIAATLVERSALTDSSAFVRMLDAGYLRSGDASVRVVEALAPLYANVTQQLGDLRATENNLNARLARVRLAVFGADSLAPDATFTPRLADGRVQRYPYNGTVAPAFTNFLGLLDHYYSYGLPDWTLPARWLNPPPEFDPETPLNLVATNDITGGNSGSALLNADLEVVGLIFDSNIEALPNEYLYTDETARAIAVDARGILEALDDLYDYDRLADELRGTYYQEEAEADAREGASASR